MFPALLLLAGLASADRITLEVSNETVPSGATTQIKISLARPLAVARGTLFVDLDRSVFGEIWSVGVFSAAGDAFGEAFTNCTSTCIGAQQPLKIDFES